MKSVKGTIAYLLTHSAYIQNKQAVSYFGICSNNKIIVERIKERVEHKCDICGSSMWLHKSFWIDEAGKVLDYGDEICPHYVYKVTVKYRLPKKKPKKQ
jgi:hypothetical protein